MTPAELAALLVAFATLVSSVAALIVALRSASSLHEVHRLVNGQSEQLLDLVKTNAFKAGQAYGRAESERPLG